MSDREPSTFVSYHSLTGFGLRDMIECGRFIRGCGSDAASMEDAAVTLVQYLYRGFRRSASAQSDCALVRCFKTHPIAALPAELEQKARAALAGSAGLETVPCLTLLASAGDQPAWNDPTLSSGHAVIPLESAAAVSQAPMIMQLIRQLGFEVEAVLEPDEGLILEADERTYGIFHVERAVGSAYIPAQQDFVLKHGIESVIGCGGLLPSGELFAVILFSKVRVSREVANMFRTLALSVRLVLLPFTWGPIFRSQTPGLALEAARPTERDITKSEIATLRMLIPALEAAAIHQTDRLQEVIADLHREKSESQELGARLTIATEAVELGIFTWYPQTDTVVWENDRMFAMTGRTREQEPLNAARFMEQLIMPEFRKDFARVLWASVASGAPFSFQCKIRMNDLSQRWICFDGRMEKHPDGTPFRMIGAAQDLTKSHEDEEALRLSEGRLRLAQLSANISTWEWDLESGRLIWDEGCIWTYGRPPGEMMHIDQIWSYLVEEDRARVARDLQPAIEGRGDYQSEFRVVWPNGSIHWLDGFGKTAFSADGKPQKIIGVNVDTTERHLSHAALLQNEKLAAVGRLASSIAHEINNPLEAVTNLLYLARGSEDMTTIQRYLDTAEEELRRVSNIANQTLRFHRQSSRPRDVTCIDLIATVLSMYEGRLKNSRIVVEKRKRADKPVMVYEGEIRQVLNNLIGNAIDAMPTGGRLVVRSRNATNWKTGAQGIVLTFADTGAGIAPEQMNRIFEAFFTTKGIGGTGLGLWISLEIVQRHDGVLRLRSSRREGHRGTVATIFIPLLNPVAQRPGAGAVTGQLA